MQDRKRMKSQPEEQRGRTIVQDVQKTDHSSACCFGGAERVPQGLSTPYIRHLQLLAEADVLNRREAGITTEGIKHEKSNRLCKHKRPWNTVRTGDQKPGCHQYCIRTH